jgi:hypothetical protein
MRAPDPRIYLNNNNAFVHATARTHTPSRGRAI